MIEWLQKTPASFDVSVWEFFWGLTVGVPLVMAAADGHRDPEYLADLIVRERVTTVHFVPSMLDVFLAELDADRLAQVGRVLRRVVCSGEALPATVTNRFHELLAGPVLENLYGPTEAAVDVSYWPVPAEVDTVPIGLPVWNTSLLVLDAQLRRVPVGTPGELYLAGVQLARGYLGKPGLTADRFVANPYGGPGERMYRTGDVVSIEPDGAISYLGRSDDQVKVHGLRIELGDITTALLDCPDVAQAAVAVHTTDAGASRIVGYVVPQGGPRRSRHCATGWPPPCRRTWCRPIWFVLDRLPLTPNGKLDRKALPAPSALEPAESREPATDAERTLTGHRGRRARPRGRARRRLLHPRRRQHHRHLAGQPRPPGGTAAVAPRTSSSSARSPGSLLSRPRSRSRSPTPVRLRRCWS